MTTAERPVRFKPNLCQVFSVYQDTFYKLAALEAKERFVKFWFRLSLIVLTTILISVVSFFPGIKELNIAISVLLAGFLIYRVWMSRIREDRKDREKEIRLLAEELGYI